ncbi:MAG: filamentous hemagglutinin N-terminal domain-containing protein [Betaproteobacteria bacterium]|nr:filamentous hemagglutinin N-terminal domain-containing protein [Betaproteobacteria bacterium]
MPLTALMIQSNMLTGLADCGARIESRRYGNIVVAALTLACLPWSGEVLAQNIKTDASWGRTAQTLTGPSYAIPQSLGKLAGNNLFHSFDTFNIKTGESAVFSTTTTTLQNVISRVSGGSASSINGKLQLVPAAGSAPSFFFINPAGVTFGAGASVDVPGAFHVSTANHLKLSDGTLFRAGNGPDSSFSVAAPEAFCFLSGVSAPIRFTDRVSVSAKPKQAISLTGGDVEVSNSATLRTNGGDMRIAAVGPQTIEIGLDSPLPATGGILRAANGGRIDGRTNSSYGPGNIVASADQVVLNNGGKISTTSFLEADAGSITIRARDVTVDGKGQWTAIYTDGPAGVVEVTASGAVTLRNRGEIASYGSDLGHAGDVRVSAGSLLIDAQPANTTTRIYSESRYSGPGTPGKVQVSVDGLITLLSGGWIWTNTRADGNAGEVSVRASGIAMDGKGIGTAIRSDASLDSLGASGNVEVATDGSITLLNGGTISANTSSSANGGNVHVRAAQLTIDDMGSSVFTGITAHSGFGGGPAGTIDVAVSGPINLLGGGVISSDTYSSGNAGTVAVRAGSLTIDGQAGNQFTGITSQSLLGSGRAGRVDVTASGQLDIVNGGAISTSTSSEGNGGTVAIRARDMLIDGRGGDFVTGVSSDSVGVLGDGRAGDLNVQVSGNLTVLAGGSISSNTSSKAPAGNVEVTAGSLRVDGFGSMVAAVAAPNSAGQTGNVTVVGRDAVAISNSGRLSLQNAATVEAPKAIVPGLLTVRASSISLTNGSITTRSTGNVAAGNIQVNFTDRLWLDPSSISTSANEGNGGSIRVQGGKLMVLDNSQITTSVLGASGNGGDISLNAQALVMNTGFIQANTAAQAASGGNVFIDVGALIPSGSTLTLGSRSAHAFAQGVFGYNVIEAAAPDGISGAIQVSSPALDLAGALGGLSTAMIDFGALGKDPCRVGAGSSFTPVGRGGLPPTVSGLIRPEPRVTELPAKAGGFTHGARLAQASPPAQMPVGRGCR